MIVVKIEMHPHGDERGATELYRLEISNLAMNQNGRANYGLVMTDASTGETCRIGFLADQPRRDGYAPQLVSNALHALGLGPVTTPTPFDLSRIEIDPDAQEDDSFDFSR